MNSFADNHERNQVKRDRPYIGWLQSNFLYTYSDQIGSSVICMGKPRSNHYDIEFIPNFHTDDDPRPSTYPDLVVHIGVP